MGTPMISCNWFCRDAGFEDLKVHLGVEGANHLP